ncbi:MAG: glycosyltransferase [Clostridia bacterium]|nr:glycosyltransferase [Clostridia bacterium]
MEQKDLTLQVLIAAMNQTDFSLIRGMNINADAIMANQTDNTSNGEFEIDEHNVVVINSTFVGVGANRNLALDNATADIVLFADDDMVYSDDMAQGVLQAFVDNPKADVMIFGCTETNPDGEVVMEYAHKNSKRFLVHTLRYPTYVIAARRSRLQKKKIRFSQMFGQGSCYGFGEDTVFLADCFKKGLRVYSSEFNIGTSTKEFHWFDGYNEKFFFGKGALYRCIFGVMAPFACAYYSNKYSKTTGVSRKKINKYMEKGVEDYQKKVKLNNFQSDGM